MIKFIKKFFTLPSKIISKKAKNTKLAPEMNRKHVAKVLFFLTICLFAIFIFRLVWLVTINKVGTVNLRENATNNHQSTVSVKAKRGTIYDRYGAPIAIDSSSYTIYAVLDKKQKDNNGNKLFVEKKEFEKVAAFLNNKLDIDKELITKQLNQSKASQVQFGTKGSNISLQKIQELQKEIDNEDIVGLGFISNVDRSYPKSSTGSGFASQFIGTATNNGESLAGVDGLELSYNSILSGKDGIETYEKNSSGRPIPGTTKIVKQVENGDDVYTTIDSTLQSQLEVLMDKAAESTGAQQLSATLMSKDGQILATTQRPTYNSEDRNTASKKPYFSYNSLLFQSVFEPGSVFKTFLMSSALDSGKVDLNATYNRTNFQIADNTIYDADYNENKGQYLKPVTGVTFANGFMMSSNVGMSHIEQNMGYPLWKEYLQKYKFNTRTRTGLSEEVIGSLPAANVVSQVQSAFGQGISVTQIQLLRGWTAFANQGVMLEPQGVTKLVNTDNETELIKLKEVIGKPVSSNAISETLSLMEGVDTNEVYGTAYTSLGDAEDNMQPHSPLIQVNGNPAAVKTGTAQIADNGKYIDGLESNLYSMVAMYPPSDPDYIMYVNIKLPTKAWSLHYISRVVNPMLTLAESRKSQIFQTINDDKKGKIDVGNYVTKEPGTSLDSLRQRTLQPVLVGATDEKDVKISKQSINPEKKVTANTRILLLTNGAPELPDMYGWTKKEVEQVAQWYGLNVTYSGNGNTVATQDITQNSKIKKEDKINIKLE